MLRYGCESGEKLKKSHLLSLFVTFFTPLIPHLSPRFKNDAIASSAKQEMDFVGLGKVNIQVSSNAGGGVCDVGTECLLAKTDKKERGYGALLARV